MTVNPILDTDSYKASHFLQYPPNTDATFFYVESRGGAHDRTLFFGLQSILLRALSTRITEAHVREASAFFAAHGEPFNDAGWLDIATRLSGRLPIRVRAVPEGTVVPTHQALVTVESTDPSAFWLPSYLETLLLRLWYPVTVATTSWHVKQLIRGYLERTSDDVAGQLPFKLHDFGSRGVSSAESAAIGGMAHLVSFLGTDTVLGVLAARDDYDEPMAGFSIPAAEHSTITSWGRDREVDAYRNMVRQFSRPGSIVAVVSDSYDVYEAVKTHWGKTLRDEVVRAGGTLVVRPDSGDPVEVVVRCLELLDEAFGHDMTSKGFRVLRNVRVIQGDGISPSTIGTILERITAAGYATDNVAFGMGGGLLQRVDRDTQKFALKCSAARVGGEWIDVYKDPITDVGKRSKRGRIALTTREDGSFATVRLEPDGSLPHGHRDAMETVYENGELVKRWTFAEVRARSDASRG